MCTNRYRKGKLKQGGAALPAAVLCLLGCCLCAVNGSAADKNHSAIYTKNVFSPARREYRPPKKPPAPVRKKPRKRYWPDLCGTVFDNGKALALVRYRPFKTSRKKKRGKRTQGLFEIGDRVGAFYLRAIEKDHIVLDFEGETVRRYLH